MRVLVMVKATRNSEAGAKPSSEGLTAMNAFNEELVRAGVMLSGDGLQPSRHGKRMLFAGGLRQVVDGPFAETRSLLAGFWIWKVDSVDEAIGWLRRCPDPMPGEEAEFEVRPLLEAEDFGDAFTPELQAREQWMRDEIERQRRQ